MNSERLKKRTTAPDDCWTELELELLRLTPQGLPEEQKNAILGGLYKPCSTLQSYSRAHSYLRHIRKTRAYVSMGVCEPKYPNLSEHSWILQSFGSWLLDQTTRTLLGEPTQTVLSKPPLVSMGEVQLPRPVRVHLAWRVCGIHHIL